MENYDFQLNIIRIWKQLEYFQQYQERVSGMIGEEQTERLVKQSLVLITLGGNDFVNNYYLVPYSARSRQYSLPDYVRYLISEYRKILLVRNSLPLFYSSKLPLSLDEASRRMAFYELVVGNVMISNITILKYLI